MHTPIRFHRVLFALAALSALALPAVAEALQQPDGTTIPVVDGDLGGIFAAQGENIDVQAAAAAVPETFTPSCSLQFEVLGRYASYQNSFGWYNVTGQAPAVADLHEFLSCTDPVGTVRTLDIKNDPAYLGGDIGFYQAVGACATLQNHIHIVYSQKQYNPDAQQQNPYIHLLIYDSGVIEKAFYFAWEDLLQGGDNDFSDLVTLVTGITCTGGGGPCDTGQPGVCADGTLQCQSGTLQCVPNSSARPEECNALDDDCDGETDEDPDICSAGLVCADGTCVPPCGTEFPCPPGKACSNTGLCIDEDCLNVDCPEPGTKCMGGVCKAPCDGVVCPHSQVCRVGACVDPCAQLGCDIDQVCELGVCVEKCNCAGCDAGKTCDDGSGHCLLDDCVSVDCPVGTHCEVGGDCVSDCTGATCPAGEICEAGECIQGSGGGGTGGSNGFGGFGVGGGGGSSSSGSGASGGAGGSNGASGDGALSGSCGCRLTPPSPAHHALWLLALGALWRGRRRGG